MKARPTSIVVALSVALSPAVAGATTPSPTVIRSLETTTATGKALDVLAASYSGGPAAAPDGRLVAFADHGVRLSTGVPSANRLLSSTPADDASEAFAWSGDGSHLAVAICPRDSTASATAPCVPHVTTFDVATGASVTLPFPADAPSLSSDGTTIAVTAYRADGSVAGVEVATPGGRIVRRFPFAEALRFAPRGDLVAYTTSDSGICVMRANGSRRRCIVRGAFPVWSPDGRRIAYQATSDAGFTYSVHVVSAVGRHPRSRLVIAAAHRSCLQPLSPAPDLALSWSPDGRLLASDLGVYDVVRGKRVGRAPAGCTEGAAFLLGRRVVWGSASVGFGGG